jgi:hypothetical protein
MGVCAPGCQVFKKDTKTVKAGRYDNSKFAITSAKGVRDVSWTHGLRPMRPTSFCQVRCVLALQLKRSVGRDKENGVAGHYSGANMKLLGYIEARKVRSCEACLGGPRLSPILCAFVCVGVQMCGPGDHYPYASCIFFASPLTRVVALLVCSAMTYMCSSPPPRNPHTLACGPLPHSKSTSLPTSSSWTPFDRCWRSCCPTCRRAASWCCKTCTPTATRRTPGPRCPTPRW